MTGIFGTATSALNANQRALATIGHNIANAATEGYSRQRVELVNRPSSDSAGGFIGSGVDSATVRRAYDGFVAEQLTSAISSRTRHSELASFAGRIDDLLADPSAGLAPALDRFGASLHDLASDPASSAARTAVLAEAEALATRFNSLDGRLADIEAQAGAAIELAVTEINSAASSLADLNEAITLAHQRSGGQPPNDLLDERDRLLADLAERTSIRVTETGAGAVDVFIGQGQSLVLGSQASTLVAPDRSVDPAAPTVALRAGTQLVDLTSFLDGGRLGGIIEFEQRVLDGARNGLGRLAVGVSEQYNAVHELGQDLDGFAGGALFRDVTASGGAFEAPANTGTAAVDVSIVDIGAATTSDYSLRRRGGAYELTRIADGQVTDVSGTFGGPAPASVVVDGVRFALASGALADGDAFLIRPTRSAAGLVDVVLSDPQRLAAGGRLRSQAGTANTGDGAISQPTVGATTNLPLSGSGGPITLTFDAATNQFAVAGGPGGTLAYDPAADFGGVEFSFPTHGGARFTISGVPRDGDTFVVRDNAGGRGDNRTALALAAVETAGALDGGTSTAGEAYGGLVSAVASRTREAGIGLDAENVRLETARAQREAVSGVNLDEEAADLIRFQQAYQAAARVVQVADELFDSLIRAVGG